MTDYIEQIMTYFRNLSLNSMGVERDLYELMTDKDVDKAIALMQNRDEDVDNAIQEYNTQTHRVMRRPNKMRKNDAPYITEKLPRNRQKYINEIELFFLLGSPIEWKKDTGDDEAYKLFTDFIKDYHIDNCLRKAKRLAGAETESAILFHFSNKNGQLAVKPVVLARSTGYKLRPLLDQYGNLSAFAYGYKLKENGTTVEHWDVHTADMIFYCKRDKIGWEVDPVKNPTGKINIVYFKQEKAWEGVQERIEREEKLDSNVADTNNYFADPIAMATADVIENMARPESIGKLIQLTGSNSQFGYVDPPQASELRRDEMDNLNKAILFDSFTPDFSYDSLKGMGTLSGAALHNALILGYIKRDNRKEVYGELVERLRNVILSVLKVLNASMTAMLGELRIDFAFSEPFKDDKETYRNNIAALYSSGVLSLETAVPLLGLTDTPQEEIERLRRAKVAQGKENAGSDGKI